MKKCVTKIIIFLFLMCMMPLSTAYAATSMAITSPNGGEILTVGLEYTITWSFGNVSPVGPCLVYASYDGVSWSKIATVPQNQAYVKWTISDEIVTTNYARIRVDAPITQSSFCQDISDNYFTIKDPDAPNAPSNLNVAILGDTDAKLTWTDNSSNESGFYVYRQKGDGNSERIAILNKNITSFTDSSLVQGVKYTYYIGAYNSKGAIYSGNCSITIPLLSAPTNLTATAKSSSRIDLTWKDNSNNEQGFKIYRKNSGGSYAQIATLGAGVQVYNDSGLSQGTKYTYMVYAFRDGATAYTVGDEVSATTNSIISNPSTAPSAPTELKASATRTGTGILLTWKDNSNNEDGFQIWRKKAGGSYQLIIQTEENITQYSDSGLNTGTTYYYRISSVKGTYPSSLIEANATTLAGSSEENSEDSLSTLTELSSIPAPSELKAVLNADGSVQLSWMDNATEEKGFKIERNESGSDTFTQIATVGENLTTYKDSGDFTGTVNYRVRAYSTLKNSSYSNTASIVPSESGLSDQTGITDVPASGEECMLQFYIDNVGYKVNGQTLIADASPTIKNNRTLMPVRYIATPLGAEVGWDPIDKKVTVTLDDKKLEMWIGNNTALVNGVSERIDPDNPEVMPEILPPGRTMLPLRFIAEKLGCDVGWEPSIKEVKLTYVKP